MTTQAAYAPHRGGAASAVEQAHTAPAVKPALSALVVTRFDAACDLIRYLDLMRELTQVARPVPKALADGYADAEHVYEMASIPGWPVIPGQRLAGDDLDWSGFA